MEKADDNTFKFIFTTKGDRDHVYQLRPWYLDGAHLILKPWPEDKVLRNISFTTTTLWMQIHDLPPAVVHQGTVERLGNRVGKVHMETVNRRCVMAHTYLLVMVDISIQ